MGLLDTLLVAGQELLQSTTNTASNTMGIPKQGEPARQDVLSGLGKGALAGGALAMLLGTKTGRKIGGSALEMGSMAALAGVAYKAYQSYSNKAQNTVASSSRSSSTLNFDAFNNVTKPEQLTITSDQSTRAILKAVIAGAKSNGHIDPQQQQMIQQSIEKSNATPELITFLQEEISRPLDVTEFSEYASDSGLASQVYLACLMVINTDNTIDSKEQQFLESLAEALNLDAQFAEQLHEQLAQQ